VGTAFRARASLPRGRAAASGVATSGRIDLVTVIRDVLR
jgi:hypothetical protein